jgi:hypothetical protein
MWKLRYFAFLLAWVLPAAGAFAEPEKCEAWQRPDGYDESWIPVSFRSTCAEHSKCYEKTDASWSACNSLMYSSLRKSCETMYPHAALSAAGGATGKGSDDEASGEASLMTCLQVADEFYSKVQSPAALKHFQASQEKPVQKAAAL